MRRAGGERHRPARGQVAAAGVRDHARRASSGSSSIFTAARFILAPLIFKLSFKYVRALTGGIALVTTFVGLLVTTWLTDGLHDHRLLDLGDRDARRLAVRRSSRCWSCRSSSSRRRWRSGRARDRDPADALAQSRRSASSARRACTASRLASGQAVSEERAQRLMFSSSA